MHRIVVVTPAGRKRYLEILARYILGDSTVDEWHLWDNCRNPADRAYLYELVRSNSKIKIVTIDNPDGTNRSVNRFYRYTNDKETFYIKMDDDIVWLPAGFGGALYARAAAERENVMWWSPLVINNAICSWHLKHHSRLEIAPSLTAQASCPVGWRSPRFAYNLHSAFLNVAVQKNYDKVLVPDLVVSGSRFSINCIGYFGADVQKLGDAFCPENVDDEEWISAILPTLTNKSGKVIGSLQVAHFSFFTQEDFLLQTDILARYAKLAGLPATSYGQPRATIDWRTLKGKIKGNLLLRCLTGRRPDLRVTGF